MIVVLLSAALLALFAHCIWLWDRYDGLTERHQQILWQHYLQCREINQLKNERAANRMSSRRFNILEN